MFTARLPANEGNRTRWPGRSLLVLCMLLKSMWFYQYFFLETYISDLRQLNMFNVNYLISSITRAESAVFKTDDCGRTNQKQSASAPHKSVPENYWIFMLQCQAEFNIMRLLRVCMYLPMAFLVEEHKRSHFVVFDWSTGSNWNHAKHIKYLSGLGLTLLY